MMNEKKISVKIQKNPKKPNGKRFYRFPISAQNNFFCIFSMQGGRIDYIRKKNDFCVITLIAKNEVSPI
jgi:hypothetical protein